MLKSAMQTVVAATALLLVLAVAVPASTLTNGPRAVAEIPFAFEIGNHTMPAGRYEIQTSPANQLLILTDPTGRGHAYLVMPLGNPDRYQPGRLVFEKSGSVHRLRQVWTGGNGLGSALPGSKQDRQTASSSRYGEQLVVVLLQAPGAPANAAQ